MGVSVQEGTKVQIIDYGLDDSAKKFVIEKYIFQTDYHGLNIFSTETKDKVEGIMENLIFLNIPLNYSPIFNPEFLALCVLIGQTVLNLSHDETVRHLNRRILIDELIDHIKTVPGFFDGLMKSAITIHVVQDQTTGEFVQQSLH